MPVSFVVYPAGAETYVMSYPDRSSLIDAGWSFLARRADGSARNTEHAVQGDVVYSSAGLRVHADVGDLWEELNNTQNSLFRSLPGHWKSVRVRLDFAPVRNYEQAGIAVYGDDDNYVFIARAFENGNRVTLAHERNGVAQLVGSAAQSAIRNLFLRLDRDGATITGAYSLDGSAWTTIGSVTETINNPRLALLSTGLEGPWTPEGYSDATFHEVHVILDEPPTAPVLSVDATSLGFSTHAGAESVPPRVVTIENAGAGTLEWTATLDAASATWLAAAPSSGVGNGQVSVTVDPSSLTPGTYSGAITVTAAGADNSPQVIGVQLTVHPAGVATFNMRYADRASLLADGWDFQARTSAGTARNTEQSSGATVVYDPGSPLRIPADVGDMWESQNDTRNTLFRDLPSQWTSVRVRMDFAPVQNYQQAGVMVYQDDDNYVYVTRIFNNGHLISLAAENGGTADVIGSAPVSATTDMYLRLDRDLSSGVISGAYSLDGGVTWNALGNVNQTVANPRLALVVGASPGGFPEATFHEVQIFMDQEGASPVIALSDASLSLAVQEGSASISRTISVSNGGDGLLDWIATVGGDGPSWLTVSPGAGAAPSEITVTVNPAGLPVGTYTRSITLTAEGAANSPRVVPVTLTVYSDADELYVFDYANRAALLADGWDFVARTATGSARDTEQTSGAVVVYDPANRVLRVPADVGDLWASLNDTRNSLFRDVPSNWTSVRVLLDFAPTQNYQQAGIVIYDDDDNYVQVTRIFENEQSIVFANEVDGFGTVLAVSPTSATTHIFLRLDRDSSSGAIAGLYSLDGGDTWHTLGSVVQTLSNPRFGLIVGASPGGFPEAVFHVAQVFVESQPAVPVLSLSATSLSFATSEGSFPLPQLLEIENAGTGTLAWTAVVGGSGPEWLSVTPASGSGNGVITVNALAAGLSAGTYTRTITVAAPGAANSPQNVSVTLVVAPLGSEFYSMSYADRASLLADGWDFQARTASGGSRNTEQANGLVVVYDAFGALRIPADMGDLWGEQNDTRNSLFRDLPADWRSVWVRLDFAPWQNYQQAGFVIYDDDDNYVQVTRIYSNGHAIAFAREVQGNAEVLSSAAVSATTNLLLRIDREANVFSAQFSLDGGQTWHVLGSAEQAFDAPRLGLIVGASPDGAPEAAFHSVQVHTQSTPWLSLEESSLTVSAAQGGSVPTRAIGVTVTGAGMPTWTASVDPGASDWLLVSPATGSGSGTMLVAFDTFGLVPGVYTGSITVAAPGVVNGHQTVAVTLTVTSSSVTQYVLDYPNRTSLLADGWDFFARTPFGGLRDTEQTSGAVVQYNVSGKLVVPADVGDLWEGQNDTRNSIFRDLPSDWESVRVQLDFAPVQNYQQAGIVVYDDDDNYVHVTRIFNNGQLVVLANEAGGVASVQGAVATTASQGLLLRLDRNAANEAITGYLSVDGGASWVTLGSVARTFANPRLGLIAGASPGGFPGAYFESVEVWRQP
ncbi:MAG: hypothetical protein WBE98_12080 [Gammaproteobacteria bacterium]